VSPAAFAKIIADGLVKRGVPMVKAAGAKAD